MPNEYPISTVAATKDPAKAGLLYSSAIKDAVFFGVNASDSDDLSKSEKYLRKRIGNQQVANRYGSIRLWENAVATGWYRPRNPVSKTEIPPEDTGVPLFDNGIATYKVEDHTVGGEREIRIDTFLGIVLKNGTPHILKPKVVHQDIGHYPIVIAWLKSLNSSSLTKFLEQSYATAEEFDQYAWSLEDQAVAGTQFGQPLEGVLTGRFGEDRSGTEHYEVKVGDALTSLSVKSFRGTIGDPNGESLLVEKGGYLTAKRPGAKPWAPHSVQAWANHTPMDIHVGHPKGHLLSEFRRTSMVQHIDPDYKGVVVTSEDPAVNGRGLSGEFYKFQHRVFLGLKVPAGETPGDEDWMDLSDFTGSLFSNTMGYGARYENGKVVELLGHHPHLGYNKPEPELAF